MQQAMPSYTAICSTALLHSIRARVRRERIYGRCSIPARCAPTSARLNTRARARAHALDVGAVQTVHAFPRGHACVLPRTACSTYHARLSTAHFARQAGCSSAGLTRMRQACDRHARFNMQHASLQHALLPARNLRQLRALPLPAATGSSKASSIRCSYTFARCCPPPPRPRPLRPRLQQPPSRLGLRATRACRASR
jgi:hypothetical protein